MTVPKRFVSAGVAVAVLLAAGALVVTQRGSSAHAGYRTATVATQAVDQTLARVGIIEPVAQAAMSFPVAGTVASVDVAAGDRVSVGQSLARLDTTGLDGEVADAQAALDQAELTLERALDGESVSSGPGGSGSDSLTAAPAAYVTTQGQDDTDLAAAQQAVLSAQQQVDTDLAAAQQALDDAQAICAAVTATDDTTDDTTATTASTVPGDGDVSACQSALTGVLAAQQAAATSQSALADASRALDRLLGERAAATPAPSDDPGTTTPTTGQARSGGVGSAAQSGSSGSPTSAELIAYQKAVDVAAADVAVARQAAAQATLVSPIAGTVQQVGIAAGDTVAAGSSTPAVVVVGDGGYEVTTTVTVDDLPDLAVGQPVSVVADGSDEAVDAEVVAIGTAATSSGSATTYPVTIGLTGQPDGLRNGATASLTIVTARTGDAIAVPTSAVHVQGGRATVTVLDGGSTSDVTVQTGAVGPTWTEITSGLDLGQTVVLADLGEPLPSDATDAQTPGGFGGPGGFRGFNR